MESQKEVVMGFWKKLFGGSKPEEGSQNAGGSAPEVKKLSFAVVVFDSKINNWLGKNIGSQQEALEFAVAAIKEIGGDELFPLFEDLVTRKGAEALTMMGMENWNTGQIMEKIDMTFGEMPGVRSSKTSFMRVGSGPDGGNMAVVFLV